MKLVNRQRNMNCLGLGRDRSTGFTKVMKLVLVKRNNYWIEPENKQPLSCALYFLLYCCHKLS